MVQVPSERGQGPADRVQDRVLHDVDGTRQVGGKEPLGPAWQPVGLGQEAPGEQAVIRGDLTVHHIFSQHVGAGEGKRWLGGVGLRALGPR